MSITWATLLAQVTVPTERALRTLKFHSETWGGEGLERANLPPQLSTDLIAGRDEHPPSRSLASGRLRGESRSKIRNVTLALHKPMLRRFCTIFRNQYFFDIGDTNKDRRPGTHLGLDGEDAMHKMDSLLHAYQP